MGWLSNIFKSKPESGTKGVDTSQEISLDDLILLLEKKIQEKNPAHESDLKNLHGKITESMREFSTALSQLLSAKGPEKIDEGLLKLARSYSSSMNTAFNATRMEFEKEVSMTVEDFDGYFKKCASSLNNTELAVARYIAPLKEIFPKEMKETLNKSEKMNNVVLEVRERLGKKKIEMEPLTSSLKLAKGTGSALEKMSDLKSQIDYTKSEIEGLELSKAGLEQKISDFLRGEQWAEHQSKLAQLSSLEKKRDEIRTFVVHSIVPLDRPMKKLKKIHADAGKKIENEDVFDLYINDPVEAFLQDSDQKILTGIVAKIKDVYEKVSPDSLEKKDQKILESISALESGELMQNARRDYDKIEVAIVNLQMDLETLGAKEAKSRLDEDLKSVVNRIPETRAKAGKLDMLYSKVSEEKTETFDKMKQAIAEALGEEIRIQPA